MSLKHRWLKKPTIKTEEMIRLYEQGLSTNQIAKQLNVIGSTVVRRLKKAGVTLRTSSDYDGEKRYWRWKGADYIDAVTRKRNSRKHQKWSKGVLERDKYTCQTCGKKDTNSKHHRGLHAHHIIALRECINSKLEFDISNGMTLCPMCHKELHMLLKV